MKVMNLKERRQELGLTLEEIGNVVGVGKSTVRKWETGFIENMGRDKIVALSNALKISPLDILYSTEEISESVVSEIAKTSAKLVLQRQHTVLNFAKKQLSDQKMIPTLPKSHILSGRSTAAGAPIDGDYEDAQQEIIVRNEVPRGADEVVTIAGDSMEPLLKQGSQAFVHYQPTPDTDGQIVIVSIKGDGVTCKRIYREDGKIRLTSINEKYEDMVFPAEDIRIIGKVIISQKK
jgi:phage repressor protein C with HTH and peptisase S24 domain/DNA-binding XRE family transcriptional regulator